MADIDIQIFGLSYVLRLKKFISIPMATATISIYVLRVRFDILDTLVLKYMS